MLTTQQRRQSLTIILVFTVLAVAFYLLGYWLIYRFERATPLMFSVGAAAITTCLLCGKPLSSLGWSWGHDRYQWLSYFIPVGIVAVAYLAIWSLGLGDWYDVSAVATLKTDYNLSSWSNWQIIAFHVVASASISFMLLLPSVLGEEIAWRGLLVPELAKLLSFTGVALSSGILWALFHWPLIILGLSNNGVTPLYYQLLCFSVFIVSISFVMAYLRLRSGSVWTAVIFHMSINLFLQKVFEPLNANNATSAWFVGENGAILALTSLLVGVYFWRLGKRRFSTV